ncbi:MAG: PEP-CTERM sorting domain-containing protein [Opitutales bacterium]
MKTLTLSLSTIFILSLAHGQSRITAGGLTLVDLDLDLLEAETGLMLTATGTNTQTDNLAGDFDVAFPHQNSSTFSYNPLATGTSVLTTATGQIDHLGTLTFGTDMGANANLLTIGDFVIGFDANRVDPNAVGGDGFFIQSTLQTGGLILFDVDIDNNPSVTNDTGGVTVIPEERNLFVGDLDLLISSEFSQVLINEGLTTDDLAGVDIGGARINAEAVPEPSSVSTLLAAAVATLAFRKRRAIHSC